MGGQNTTHLTARQGEAAGVRGITRKSYKLNGSALKRKMTEIVKTKREGVAPGGGEKKKGDYWSRKRGEGGGERCFPKRTKLQLNL